MEKTREHYLDMARGACVLSVVFIHTVFWSGYGYVPEYMRSLALLLDVPAFFFLAGVTFAMTGKNRVPAAVFSFALYFALIALVHDTLAGEGNFTNLVKCLILQNPDMKYLPVVGGSYWFVPVFVVVSLFAAALTEYAPRTVLPLILLIFLFYLLEFMFFPKWWGLGFTVLGSDLHYVLFYLKLYLTGWLVWKQWQHRGAFWPMPLCAVAGLAILWAVYGNDILFLQNYKFPPQLPYVIAAGISIGIICMLWNNARRNRFLEYLGQNALAWYAGQGVGASLLMFIGNGISLYWPLKLALFFALNVLCTALVAEILIRADMRVRRFLRPAQAG